MSLQNQLQLNLPEIFNNGTFEPIYFRVVDLNEQPINLQGSFINCTFNYKTTNGIFHKIVSTVLGITILDEQNGSVRIDGFQTTNIESGGYDFNLEIKVSNINGISVTGNCCIKYFNIVYKINIQEKNLNVDSNAYPYDNFLKLIFSTTMVSIPIKEVAYGTGTSITSSPYFWYDPTDGSLLSSQGEVEIGSDYQIFLNAPSVLISSLSGNGNQMVVVDDDGLLSTQNIPSSPTLTKDYIGFGNNLGLLDGVNKFTYADNGSNNSNLNIEFSDQSGYTGTTIGSGTSIGGIYRFGNTYIGAYIGTSVSYADTLSIISGTSANQPIVVQGTPIVNAVGQSSANYGTRLDASGLKIGKLSGLHTINTDILNVDSLLSITTLLTTITNTLKISSLSGIGSRFLSVSSDGTVSAVAKPNYPSMKVFNYYNFI